MRLIKKAPIKVVQMSGIQIDSDDDGNKFIISGNLSDVLGKPEIKFYLKSFLYANFIEESIEIPYEVESKEKVLDKILKSFQRYGIDLGKSDNINRELKSYFQEEENFKHFSLAARLIRNNNCNQNEFELFTSIICAKVVNRDLYPLQLLSAYHLAFSQNACNFSVPGSGKTSIVYGAYSYLKWLPEDNPKHVDKLLIVGPLNSFGPWEQEYEACFGLKPRSKRLHGTVPREGRVKTLRSINPPEMLLIPYQGLPTITDEVISFLKANRTMVVLDEAHRIKNVEGGVIANAALQIATFAKARVVLTGTPMPQGYQDLNNLFKFIWPSKDLIGFKLFQLEEMTNNPNDDRIPTLIDNISPFFIRIRKSHLNLPKPNDNPPIMVDMGPIQRRVYDYIESSYLDRMVGVLSNTPSFTDVIARAKLIRLMQAATNPNLLLKPLEQFFDDQRLPSDILINDVDIMKDIARYQQNEVPQKFYQILSLLNQIINEGGKAVIWTSFVQNIHDLSDFLIRNDVDNRMIYGAVPIDLDENEIDVETRESIIRDFHKPDSSFNVIIANPHAISESISLHKVCHNAIYADRTFNAGHFIQSKDRIHRYGLKPTDVINYYYILSNNSVDTTIHLRLIEKEARMNSIIEGSEIPLFNNIDDSDLADDDIRAIILDYVKRRSEKSGA
jgi:SNF2 family DNA or RNA helicase